MSLKRELIERLNAIAPQCKELPIQTAITKTKGKALQVITDFLHEKGLWDQVKNHPPERFIDVLQGETDLTEIRIHLARPLLHILGG